MVVWLLFLLVGGGGGACLWCWAFFGLTLGPRRLDRPVQPGDRPAAGLGGEPHRRAGKPLIKLTATLSYLSPPFLTAIAFVYLFSPNAGLVNVLMRDVVGLPWLTFNIFSMTGLVLVTVLHTFPFVYLLASSALQSVDASYEEAAQILGASKLRTALSITAPLVAPAILSGTLLAFVNAIALFGSQAIIGLPGRIFTLPTRIYALFDYPPEYGLASALSLVFVIITVVALYLQRAFLARRSYVTLAGKGARPQLMALGAGRWVLLGFVLAIFVVSIVAPLRDADRGLVLEVLGLDFWKNLTLANYQFILFEYNVTQRAIVNSLMLAIAAATHRGAARRVIGWIDLRTRLPGRKLLDYASLIPLGLPGIVVAVALIQFWLAMPIALYGTLAILLLAYVGRYIPLGVRAGQRVAAPGRSVARGERADPRRLLGHHHARDHAAADPARPVRRLAPGVRAGDPGADRLDPAVQLELDHAGGRGLQPLRDRLHRAGGGARDRQHGDHRRRDLARRLAAAAGARRRRAGPAMVAHGRDHDRGLSASRSARAKRTRSAVPTSTSRSGTTSSSRCSARAAAARPRPCG